MKNLDRRIRLVKYKYSCRRCIVQSDQTDQPDFAVL